MTVAFPEVRVGTPIRCNGLAVFPLFADSSGGVDYALSDEAIGEGTVIVEEVERQQSSLGAFSGTMAMSDTFEAHRERVEDAQKKLEYVEGAIGAAVTVGGKVVSCDLFDYPPADLAISRRRAPTNHPNVPERVVEKVVLRG